MKNFILIGVAGYIAPRHIRAIRDTGNQLLAALDKNDSVGVLDAFFPDAAFFTEFERFDRHLEKLKREGIQIDFLSVCSPNYFHDAHIRFGLRHGADVICEKPLVLNPWNIEALRAAEAETGRKIYTIMQLRLLPSLQQLKRRIEASPRGKKHEVELTYITSRGNWYFSSWKGSTEKSGGIATNIGIHFYDLLQWVFGPARYNEVHLHTHDRAAGFLDMERARVRWFLSINYDTLPAAVKAAGQRTYRSINVDGEEIEFSDGFTELHTRSYEASLQNQGFGLGEAANAIQIVYDIRRAHPIGLNGKCHPLAGLPLSDHPFEGEELAETLMFA